MNLMHVIIWLLPILFIFHDFEEIIFIKPWVNRNSRYLSERFPKLAKRFLPHLSSITTSAFALGVAEEFVIISMITVISYLTSWYGLWIGLFLVFSLHLVMHCMQTLIVRRYVPAVVTSVLCMPACFYIIKYSINFIPLGTTAFYTVLSMVVMLINLVFIHKWMEIFSAWENQSPSR